MKIRNLLLQVAFLTIMVTGVAAQQATQFTVSTQKGQNEVQSPTGKKPLKTGLVLKEEDVLVLGEGSYVALIPKPGGIPKELKKAGTYPVKDLLQGVKAGASVLNKYTEFMLSSNSDERKNRLSATGAVHRGLENIKVFLPENPNNEVLNSTLVVQWESKTPVQGAYVVKVTDIFESELYSQEVNGNKTTINLNDSKYTKYPIKVNVYSKQDARTASAGYIVNMISNKSKSDKLKGEVTELGLTEETAINKFVLAGFYEEKGLFIDAIAAYEDAMKLEPEVDSYKEAYHEFLVRSGFKTQKP